MSKQINKIVDNYPVLLNRDEKDNLVKTLSSIILEVAPGGSGGGKTYYGAEGVYVDNDNNRITLESTAKNAIDNIPHAVTDLTDSADYQLKSGMTNYLTTATYETDSATFLTKTSAAENLAPISVTADVNVLKANSGDFSQYYKKTDTSSKEELSAEFDKYQTKEDMVNYTTVQQVDDIQSNLLELISSKQPKLTFGYDENSAISSIDGSALAGQGGTTYSAGAGIAIVDEYISLSADYIQAITSVSAIKGTILTGDSNILATSAEDGNNIKWTLQLTAQPVVTDTTLSGHQGIVAVKDSNVSSQWNVSIAQAYRQEIEAVSGKLTKSSADTLYASISVTGDVDTLKSSSGNWDKVSEKLDTTAFSDVSGNFLTAHQSLDNYYTKTQVDSTFASATQLNNYLTTAQYQTDSATFLTKSSADNDYAPKSVTSTVNTLTGASAGWNEVSAKLDSSVASTTYQTKEDMNDYLTKNEASTTYQPTGNYLVADDISGKLDKSIYANASGNWENTYNTVNQYSAAGTWLTDQALTNYYTKSDTSSKTEITNALNTKVDKPNTSLKNNYLVLRTDNDGSVSGWVDFNDNVYSKSEADGRYQKKEDMSSYLTTAQYALDSATFVTSSSNTITGTKQYALTTAGWEEVQAGGFTGVTTAGSISGDGLTNPLGLVTSAENALTSVAYKVDIPTAAALADKYLVYSTNAIDSGWCELTAGGGDYLPLSGGTVSGDVIVSSNGTCLLAVGTEATLMGQSRVVNLGDTTARGTNWLGVTQSNQGFLKYVNSGNVGALNGTSIQINFAPDGANSYGNITVISQNNESKVINVPTASYNSMSSFDNTNGPNYMLRKTASGFDIGACVINVTTLPAQTEANTYYFIYDT